VWRSWGPGGRLRSWQLVWRGFAWLLCKGPLALLALAKDRVKGKFRTYSEHGFFICELGDPGNDSVAGLWRDYLVQPLGSHICEFADLALEGASHAADCFCHIGEI